MSSNQNELYRHPLFHVPDRLKRIFYELEFVNLDNGSAPEVELTTNNYATFNEPDDFYTVKGSITFENGKTQLRTRLLPGVISICLQDTPDIFKPKFFKGISFGKVFCKDEDSFQPHYQLEGMILSDKLTLRNLYLFWNRFAELLFGVGSHPYLEPLQDDSIKIVLSEAVSNKTHILGYGGIASEKLISDCQTDNIGWVFSISIDDFATSYLSLAEKTILYHTDPKTISMIASNLTSAGGGLLTKFIDALRQNGYQQTLSETLYPDGIYKKMNMIQEKWDKNNDPYALDQPIGELAALCTVLSPSLESCLLDCCENGLESARIFQVGHIFRPVEDQLLPRERIAIVIGGYGPDLNFQSFTEELSKVFTLIGLLGQKYIPTDKAIAYKTDECYLLLNEKNNYLKSNFGAVSPIAIKNYGIEKKAFMANLELDAIDLSIKDLFINEKNLFREQTK